MKIILNPCTFSLSLRKYLFFVIKYSTQRARDFHKKQHTLQHLKLLASLRNPDEFHSDMVHTRSNEKGNLFLKQSKKINKKARKNANDLQARYMNMRLTNESKRLKRQLNSLHCLDSSNISLNNSNSKNNKNNNNNNNSTNSKHIIYVENDKQRRNFNASKYFETPKSLLQETHNRLKLSTLAENEINLSRNQARKLRKKSAVKYVQLQKKMHKVENMKKFLHNINMKRKIASGDPFLVYKKKDRNTGKVVKKRYKWIKERKR